MNRKLLLGLIIGFTIVTTIVIVLLTYDEEYQKLIISNSKWNSIKNTKKYNNSLSLEWLKFNDNNLIIDEDNNRIYYSLTNNSNNYNPKVDYKSNKKIAFNTTLNDKNTNVIVYNNNSYKIYQLVVLKHSFINIVDINEKEKVIEVFENISQRKIQSLVKLKTIKENEEYHFHLVKESLGNNRRDNNLSLFGMAKYDEFIVTRVNESNNKDIELFINNKYKGTYKIESNIRRRKINEEKNNFNNN